MKPYYEDTKAGITIYHGDCREILPGLPKVDLVLTDPPYGTQVLRDGYGRRQNNKATNGKVGVHIAGDADLGAFKRMVGAVKCNLLCTFGSPKKSFEMLQAIRRRSFTCVAELVWDKNIPGLGAGIRYQHENIYIAVFENFEFCGYGGLFSVIRETSVSRGGFHPHEKPVDLLKRLLIYAGGETILDPFMGSGTTLRAAKDLRRKAIGIEIEERYCEIAARRLQQEVLPL